MRNITPNEAAFVGLAKLIELSIEQGREGQYDPDSAYAEQGITRASEYVFGESKEWRPGSYGDELTCKVLAALDGEDHGRDWCETEADREAMHIATIAGRHVAQTMLDLGL